MASENDDLAEAKKKVESLYGTALAKKASNTLLCKLGSSQRDFAESSAQTQQPIVLEFTRRNQQKTDVKKIGELLISQNEEWSRLQNTLENLSDIDEGLLLQASQLLRQAQIRTIRDNFYQSVASICNEIENQEKKPFTIAENLMTSFMRTDKCWLNRSVKGIIEPELMAEIAADQKISQIDLPRPLEAEISVSTKLIRR
jgi:hypothetical protein